MGEQSKLSEAARKILRRLAEGHHIYGYHELFPELHRGGMLRHVGGSYYTISDKGRRVLEAAAWEGIACQ